MRSFCFCVLALLFAAPAFADTMLVTGSFTVYNSYIASPDNILGPGLTETYSFTVDSNPVLTPDAYDDTGFEVPSSNLVITCNGGGANIGCDGLPLTFQNPSVMFFNTANLGAFQITLIDSPTEAISLVGDQMYTGDESAPTISAGTYGVYEQQGYPPLIYTDGSDWVVTASDVTITDVSPEPGTLTLAFTGAMGGLALLRRRRRVEEAAS